MANYRLSNSADEDFESIFYYRADKHEVLIVRILRNQDPGMALVEDPEG